MSATAEPQATPKRRHRRSDGPRRPYLIGVLVILAAVLAFYLALTHRLPFTGPGGRLVTAYFREPNQIQAGNTPVRVKGYNVGTVSSVDVADGGRYGKVVLRITDANLTLHSDASAALQYRTLLGANFVVNLNPGSASAPTLSDQTIPLSHTTVQTEFDDILRVFNHHTQSATRTDLKQLASAGAGPQIGRVIDLTPSALRPTPAGFNALRGQNTNDLSRLVSSASQTMRTLSADRTDLENLISGGSATLAAVNEERGALAATVQKAPGALDATVAVSHSVESTLPALNTLLTDLGPGAVALGPAARATQPTVRKLRTVLDRLQPLLSELHPAVNQLAAASPVGQRVLTGLAPTLSRLNTQILPWIKSDDSDLHMPIYQLIGPTLAAFASVASEYDGDSHVIHFPAQPELNSVDLVPCTVNNKASTPAELLNCQNLNGVLDELFGATGASSSGGGAIPARRSGASR